MKALNFNISHFTNHEHASSLSPWSSNTAFLYSFCMCLLTACWEEVLVVQDGGADRLTDALAGSFFEGPAIPGSLTPKYDVLHFHEPLDSHFSTGDLKIIHKMAYNFFLSYRDFGVA